MSQQINLFNPQLIKHKSIASLLNMVVGLALVIIAVSAGKYYIDLKLKELARIADTNKTKLENLTKEIERVRGASAALKRDEKYEKELLNVEESIAKRQKIEQFLKSGNFGNTEGYSSYLTAFAKQIPNGVWLTGFSIVGAGTELMLEGRTLRPELVPTYVTQLKREKIMQGKEFSSLQIQKPSIPTAETAQANAKKTQEESVFLEFELHSSDFNVRTSVGGVNTK